MPDIEILEIWGGKGGPNSFVNYFVKIGLNENHKIVIPGQH
jgi:hypothetical protein